jgi:hypothetical protein
LKTFKPQCVKLLEASNSDNTWLTYRNGLSSFQKFRQDHGLNNVWPCPITHIVKHCGLKVFKTSLELMSEKYPPMVPIS